MRVVYLAEALRHEQRLQDYRARLLARGADNHTTPDFGAFATLKLGLALEELYAQWCRWLADQLYAGRTPRRAALRMPEASPARSRGSTPRMFAVSGMVGRSRCRPARNPSATVWFARRGE
jgi:hypothetical protein